MGLIMRAMLVFAVAALGACASTGVHGAGTPGKPSPAAPPQTDLDKRVAALASQAGAAVAAETIGTSREGRPIHLLRLSRPNKDKPLPALLIVAGLDGRHAIGTEIALDVAAGLAKDHADLLDTTTVYIVPCLNPDGAEHARADTPRRDSGRTISPGDDDRDGRVDEDPPTDLNGDGLITLMRTATPPPGYGLELTEMIDPADPRLMKRPDRAKGERATYAVLIEGKDTDGDGRIAEDGPDGTDLNLNFPYHWPEFRDGAGPSQLSEPESLALARWLMDHDEVSAVLVYGPHDNLVKTPEAGRMDVTGRVPEGIENDDKPYYEQIGKVFKDITRMTEAPTGDAAGSLHGWTYAHLGIFSFTTPVWVRPDQVKKEEPKPGEAPKKEEAPKPEGAQPGAPATPAGPSDAEIQQIISQFQSATRDQRRELMQRVRAMPEAAQEKIRAAAFGGGAGGRPGGAAGQPGQPRPQADGDEAKWLKYSDEQRDKFGFVEWKPFDHPQLGPVEIGGFVPGFKMGPPMPPNPGADAEIARLTDEQTKFAADLIGKLPRLSIEDPTVERLGPGVWRISLRIVNDGYLPTRSAVGVKARRLPPVLISISTPPAAMISGERLIRAPSIPGSGGARAAEWVIAADDGSTVELTVRSPELGEQKLPITLTEHRGGPKPPPPPPAPAPAPSDEKKAAPPSETSPPSPPPPPPPSPPPGDPRTGGER